MKRTPKKGNRIAALAADAALLVAVLLAVLAFAEAAFRFADVYPPLDKGEKGKGGFREGLRIVRIDPDVPIPFGMRPGARTDEKTPGTSDTFSVRTNNFGMRGPDIEFKKPEGAVRVLTMGDSWTFGEGVNDGETFTAQLGGLLDGSGRRVETLNAGYTAGYSPDSYYVYLMRKGFSFKPDVVVVASMVVNDLFDLGSNGWPETDTRGLPRSVESYTMRVNDKGQYGYFEDRRKQNPVMQPSRIALLNKLRVNTFWRDLLFRVYYQPYVMKNEKAGADAESGADSMKRYQLVIAGMNEECRRRGVEFVLALIPAFEYDRGKLDVNSTGVAETVNFCRRNGIRVVNLEEVMLAEMTTPNGYDWPRYHITGNGHWNARGHRVAAEAIAREIRKAK